jgi:ankyrin repeat protein
LYIAKYLYGICPGINVSVDNNHVFRTACANGHLVIAKWLYEINPYIDDISWKYAFINGCTNGHLNVVEWLRLSNPGIPNCVNDDTFIIACKYGHLNIAKYLYDLNPDINISAENEYAFVIACGNGHLNVAEWLYLIKPDINISASNDRAFRLACGNNQLNVVRWLSTFNPSKYDYKIVNDKIVSWSNRKNITINQTKQIFMTELIKCPICTIEDINIQTNCEHSYCLECITEWHNKSNTCPYCRQKMTDFHQIVEKIE